MRKNILNVNTIFLSVFSFALLGFQTAGQTITDNFALKKGADSKLEKATFGSGCFWCSEAVFERVNGVKEVESGYAGGKVIKSGKTFPIISKSPTAISFQ